MCVTNRTYPDRVGLRVLGAGSGFNIMRELYSNTITLEGHWKGDNQGKTPFR